MIYTAPQPIEHGLVLTPDMEITVTTQQYTSDPFYNGAKEIQDGK
mgnify:CR=1 FL=1